MRRITAAFECAALLGGGLAGQQPAKPGSSSLTEAFPKDAEAVLTASTVVVVPLNGAAVDRGRHLRLGADERLAKYLTSRIQSATPVVVAPPLNYHYYPTAVERPGSTTLAESTARDVAIDVVRALAT